MPYAHYYLPGHEAGQERRRLRIYPAGPNAKNSAQ